MGLLRKLDHWLDERAAHHRVLDGLPKDAPIPGEVSWSYSPISVVVVLIAFQAITGFILSLSYSPSADAAHASVRYLLDETVLGVLIRTLHQHGASFIILFLALHGIEVLFSRAYLRPRELNWIFGLVLLGLVIWFTITGYLLPWDQNALWGTQVRTSLIGRSPVVGPLLRNIMLGGTDIGNLALTRFYALHVIFLPFVAFVVIWIHITLLRRYDRRWRSSDDEGERQVRYWPAQAARDVTACLVVLLLLFAAALAFPSDLGPEANPLEPYPARPEWYFRWLFQLLKYFKGPMEVMGAIAVLPSVGIFLLAVPFLDQAERLKLGQRKMVIGAVVALALAWGILTAYSYYEDYSTGHFEEIAIWNAKADPEFDTEEFYSKECRECHGRDGAGYLDSTPDFTDEVFWNSVRSDHRLLKSILEGIPNETIPEDERMPAYGDRITPEQAKALVERKVRTFLETSE